jgi:hypothetical protein
MARVKRSHCDEPARYVVPQLHCPSVYLGLILNWTCSLIGIPPRLDSLLPDDVIFSAEL